MEKKEAELRFLSVDHDEQQFDVENNWTYTSEDQVEVESACQSIFEEVRAIVAKNEDVSLQKALKLKRKATQMFLQKGIRNLSESYSCLDASRPWLCYWILHSMKLLEIEIPSDLKSDIAQFLGKCQSESGGFGGGPMQLAHLAPTYAAVNALCILETDEALQVINREKLYQFLLSVHQKDGSFILHEGGEVDIRGCYLAASVARITNLVTDKLFDSTPQWIVACQTYEGGFGGVPGMEAHGGYAFCGLAALTLLGHEKLCDTDALLRWAVNRQMSYEGGFQGRTNKLVDACYSFWQGGIVPLLCTMPEFHSDISLYHNGALQEYILLCCQHQHGGLIDKPGKSRDYYHTCYALSGLTIAQNFTGRGKETPNVVGDKSNLLVPVHPVFNMAIKPTVNALDYFEKLPKMTIESE